MTVHENILNRIAERMKADAVARPGVKVKHEFKNGAVVVLLVERVGDKKMMRLKIVRRGLAPQNDFSREGGKRRAAWESEVETFCRAFAVPADALRRDGVETVFYHALFSWVLDAVPATGGERDDV